MTQPSTARALTEANAAVLFQNPIGLTAYAPSTPAGLGWDTAHYPISGTVQETRGGRNIASLSVTPQSIFDSVSTARSAPGATFYASPTGVDTNAGTQAAPFRSIYKAVQAANAANVPSLISVAAGYYGRQNNPWYGGGTAVIPSVDLAFVATGGRVITGTQETTYTFTKDTTFTNCSIAGTTASPTGVSNVNRIMDVVQANQFGNYTEFANVATAAQCNATPNSWTIVGSTLYINRRDQAVPNVATNTRVLRSATGAFVSTNAVSIYMENFDVEGGDSGGCLDMQHPTGTTGRRALVGNNCTFRYGGGYVDNTAGRSIAVDSWQGIVAFFNCDAAAGWSDNWNFHNSKGAAMYVLTVNCTGSDAGRAGQVSCNNWTSHETVLGVDIAGYYDTGRGGSLRSINQSKTWFSGTIVKTDLGDINLSPGVGTIPPTAVRTDDSAEYYVERVRVDMPGGAYAYVTGSATSKIHRKNAWPVGAPDFGPGVFDAAW